jgi:hypothetical protein
MTHPVKFVQHHGKLSDALGLTETEMALVDALVGHAIDQGWNLREIITAVGNLELSDEAWVNFLYTPGWWDHEQRGT